MPAPRRTLRRTLAAAACMAAGLPTFVTVAPAATAGEERALTLGIGQTVSVDGAPISGQGYVPSRAQVDLPPTPENCREDPIVMGYCDVRKVKLDVPVDRLASPSGSGLTLISELAWDKGPTVDASVLLGFVGANEMVERLYANPRAIDPDTGDPTYSAFSSAFSTVPVIIAAPNITSADFDSVVANYTGVNSGYKLTLKLVDANAPLIDFSIEDPIPEIAETPDTPITITGPPRIVTREIPGIDPPVSSPTTVAPSSPIQPTLLLPGIGGADLGFGTIGGSALPDADLAAAISGRNPLAVPRPARPSPPSCSCGWSPALHSPPLCSSASCAVAAATTRWPDPTRPSPRRRTTRGCNRHEQALPPVRAARQRASSRSPL